VMMYTKLLCKKNIILGLILFAFLSFIKASELPSKTKLSPKEWYTAPYKDVFDEVDICYAFQPKLAYQILDVLAERASKAGEPKWIYEAYRTKGLYQERQLAFQLALKNYLLASKAVENIDVKRAAAIQIDIAIVYRNTYRYNESRSTYFSLIDFCQKSKDSLNLQNAYGGLGVLFFTVNDYENAIRYYDKALQLSRETHNYIDECIYLDNLSEAYGCQRRFDKAFEYVKIATKIAEREQDKDSRIPLYERFARLYAEVGDFDKAFEKINEALMLCNDDSHIRDGNNLTIAKAEFYVLQHDIEAALKTYKTIDEKLINVNSLTKVYYALGDIYSKKNNIVLAEDYYSKSQALAEKNQSLRYAEWNHRALYKIYRRKNQSNDALFHLEKANVLRDSLFNYEKSGQVTELQFRYDLAQSEQQLKEAQLKANRVFFIAIVSVGMLLVSFLMYWLRQKSRKNDALEHKNEEILRQKVQLELFNNSIVEKNYEIEEQKRQLEDSNGMLRQFSYAVAHDLREPLRNISSFTSIIQRKYLSQLPQEAIPYFDFVTNGASRMSKMLEGLLKYSMLSMNQVTDLEKINIHDVVSDVKDSLGLIIKEKNASLIHADIMPSLTINRVHLTQLIQNLISNALKFVEVSPIIEIITKEEKDHVLLAIKDNGIGINPENGKKLFQLFHRLHLDSSRFEGTGVGLALCKTTVEKYGGKIWFESIEGSGTTFFMDFPKKQRDIELFSKKTKNAEMIPNVNNLISKQAS
jgi:signal transduction histidine kinase